MQTSARRPDWRLTFVVSALVLAGCGQRHSTQAAAEQLEQSFQRSEAALKQEVGRAASALQTSNYVAALLIMDQVVQARPIDDGQKRAVDTLILQARQAVAQNPKLNTPELYKAMSDLMVRVHGEN